MDYSAFPPHILPRGKIGESSTISPVDLPTLRIICYAIEYLCSNMVGILRRFRVNAFFVLYLTLKSDHEIPKRDLRFYSIFGRMGIEQF